MKLKFETQVFKSFDDVKSGFDRKLFEALRPPWIKLRLKRFDGCSKGHEVHLEMGQFGVYHQWVSHITDDKTDDKSWYFIDEGRVLPWPIKKWKHKHLIEKKSDKETRIIDDIQFDTGSQFLNYLIWPNLWISFAIRPKIYKKFFEG